MNCLANLHTQLYQHHNAPIGAQIPPTAPLLMIFNGSTLACSQVHFVPAAECASLRNTLTVGGHVAVCDVAAVFEF
jgi:hypothetical protein